MQPVLIALRDAVAERINALGAFLGATARGAVLPTIEPGDVPSDHANCEVMVEKSATEQFTASDAGAAVIVQVMVQKRVTNPDEEVPALVTACESVWDDLLLNEFSLADQGVAALATRVDYDPVYDKLELHENRIFAALATITFEVQ